MAKKPKPVQWYSAVDCASGKGHVIFVGLAPSPGDARSAKISEREIVCPLCGNRSVYQPHHFFRTRKGPS